MGSAIDIKPYEFDGSRKFVIQSAPTAVEPLYRDKPDYEAQLAALREAIDHLQNMMYAHDRYSMLVVFQAMDAAGKDGTIRAVFSGVNPHGVVVHSFKRPTSRELDHDFLWRTTIEMPECGRIAVFNRSHYEEVLVTRVHPQIITEFQKLPGEVTRNFKALWKDRYQAIRAFERYAADNGIVILKFFLHVSKEEQRLRFLSRIDRQEKNWKFSEQDVNERQYWDDYQAAYEKAINESAAKHAPWYVIPADDKKSMRLLVATAVAYALKQIKMNYPQVSAARREELQHYREQLGNGKL